MENILQTILDYCTLYYCRERRMGWGKGRAPAVAAAAAVVTVTGTGQKRQRNDGYERTRATGVAINIS